MRDRISLRLFSSWIVFYWLYERIFVEAISILLELGADANIIDKRGFSPVLSALGSVDGNNGIILEMLLQHGLDLERMEGEEVLLKQILSFGDEGFNQIITKYYGDSAREV